MAFVLLIFLITVLYAGALYYWHKHVVWRLRPGVSRVVKIVHYVAMAIIVAVAISFSKFDIGLAGFWTTRTFIIVALLTGLFFGAIGSQSVFNAVEKWYFKIFGWLPVISGVLMFVPFLGVVIVASLLGKLLGPVDNIYYDDDKIRIQSTFQGVLAPPRFDGYQKMGLFEKQLQLNGDYADDSDSVAVRYERDSVRIFIFTEGIGSSQKIITDTIAVKLTE